MRRIALPAFIILQLQNEIVRMGFFRGSDHLGFCRLIVAVTNIVQYRAMQQRGILRHNPDLGPQALLRDPADGLTINQNLAGLNIVKTQQQIHQC